MENRIKEKIIKLLLNHPEGLTFTQIAKNLDIHRHTVTKYIYELKGENIVFIRDLRTLKLCYLKKILENNERNSKVNK
ncbi:MAG: HTH domain-containing protein [Candidatus Aenigmatarchaeota archaeon]